MNQNPAERTNRWDPLRRRIASPRIFLGWALLSGGAGLLVAPSSWTLWISRGWGVGLILTAAALALARRTKPSFNPPKPPEAASAARHVAALVEACTPLLIDIRERAEAALRTTFLSEKTAELETIEAVANRLRRLLEAADELARLDNGTLVLEHAVFSLPGLIARALETANWHATSALSVAAGVPDLVVGDAVHAGQIVAAVLERGSRAGAPLAVVLERSSARANALSVRFDWQRSETPLPDDPWPAIIQEIDGSGQPATPLSSPLTFAARLARTMGGDIRCSEAPDGRRSIEVVLELPGERADPRTDETVLEELRGRPVLVLDGNQESRARLGSLLLDCGLRPTVTGDPQEAIATLRQAAALNEPFALLLVDPFLRGSAVFRARRNDDESLAAATPQVLLVSQRAGPDTGYGPDTARLVRPAKRGDLIAALRRALLEPPLSSERQVPVHPMRILVIQDADDDASATARAIERLGHHAAIVRDAAEAARVLAQRSFDGAVVGLGLSVTAALEGIRALRRSASESGTPLSILATTARYDAGEERACRDAGADHYLARPFPLAALQAALPHPEAPASSPPVPAIDWPRLRAQLAGNEAAVAALLGEFRALADPMLATLARAIAEGSAPATERAAHSLKGSLLWMRAAPAADLAKGIEMQARAGDVTDSKAPLAALRQEMERLLQAIEHEGAPARRSS